MTFFELSNNDRKYFGLSPIKPTWAKKSLSSHIHAYFDKNKIVKILNYDRGYFEYDIDIDTTNREFLLPKTSKGKIHKLTAPRVSKIKGTSIQFSGSFQGGGITVYDNKRHIFFIRSYFEDGPITTFNDIRKWVDTFISESSSDHFVWLMQQLKAKPLKVKPKQGDIIAFPVSRFEYGFARIILAGYLSEQIVDREIYRSNFFGKPLLILPYSFISRTVNIDFDALIRVSTLKPIEIHESSVVRGEFPIVSFREFNETEFPKIELHKVSKYLTIPYSRADLLTMTNKW